MKYKVFIPSTCDYSDHIDAMYEEVDQGRLFTQANIEKATINDFQRFRNDNYEFFNVWEVSCDPQKMTLFTLANGFTVKEDESNSENI